MKCILFLDNQWKLLVVRGRARNLEKYRFRGAQGLPHRRRRAHRIRQIDPPLRNSWRDSQDRGRRRSQLRIARVREPTALDPEYDREEQRRLRPNQVGRSLVRHGKMIRPKSRKSRLMSLTKDHANSAVNGPGKSSLGYQKCSINFQYSYFRLRAPAPWSKTLTSSSPATRR